MKGQFYDYFKLRVMVIVALSYYFKIWVMVIVAFYNYFKIWVIMIGALNNYLKIGVMIFIEDTTVNTSIHVKKKLKKTKTWFM